jgi:hypothetical protein
MVRGCTSPFIIFLSPVERAQLEHWQRSTTIQARLAKRGQIVLLRADGLALTEIGQRLGMGRRIVRKWLKRFLNQRMAGLSDKPGRGRQPVFSPRGGGASAQTGLRATG